jgi:hypothetical protein
MFFSLVLGFRSSGNAKLDFAFLGQPFHLQIPLADCNPAMDGMDEPTII